MLCPSCGSSKHVMIPAGHLCASNWKNEAYAQGRADERAAVVAWLLSIGHADDYADRVEYGEHVDAAKGKP